VFFNFMIRLVSFLAFVSAALAPLSCLGDESVAGSVTVSGGAGKGSGVTAPTADGAVSVSITGAEKKSHFVTYDVSSAGNLVEVTKGQVTTGGADVSFGPILDARLRFSRGSFDAKHEIGTDKATETQTHGLVEVDGGTDALVGRGQLGLAAGVGFGVTMGDLDPDRTNPLTGPIGMNQSRLFSAILANAGGEWFRNPSTQDAHGNYFAAVDFRAAYDMCVSLDPKKDHALCLNLLNTLNLGTHLGETVSGAFTYNYKIADGAQKGQTPYLFAGPMAEAGFIHNAFDDQTYGGGRLLFNVGIVAH
jgi:hypothetical protein